MGGGSPVEGEGQTEGMRQLAGERQRLADAGAGLLGKAKQPQGAGRMGEEIHPGVNPIAEGQCVMLLGIIEGHPLLQMDAAEGQLAKME